MFDIIDSEEAWEYVVEYMATECSDDDYCKPIDTAGKRVKLPSSNNLANREMVFFCKTYYGKGTSKIRNLMENTFLKRDTKVMLPL